MKDFLLQVKQVRWLGFWCYHYFLQLLPRQHLKTPASAEDTTTVLFSPPSKKQLFCKPGIHVWHSGYMPLCLAQAQAWLASIKLLMEAQNESIFFVQELTIAEIIIADYR